MKPFHWVLPALLTSPALVPVVNATSDKQTSSLETLLATLPSQVPGVIWVQAKRPISIEELASQLQLDETQLARLNDVNEDYRFEQGDWLSIPADQQRALGLVASLDGRAVRTSPPLRPLPTLDGLSRSSAQTQLAQALPLPRPRAVLGIAPSGSGGLSYPDTPDFGPADPEERPRVSSTWIWPSKGVFTSGYGWRWGRMHRGIDLANNVGTPIVAAREGRVTYAGWHDGGFGYLVELSHEDGSRSLYAHNSRVLVRVGDYVNQGELVSHMGSTGRSTGPHLHFEIHPPGRGAINPLQVLPPRA